MCYYQFEKEKEAEVRSVGKISGVASLFLFAIDTQVVVVVPTSTNKEINKSKESAYRRNCSVRLQLIS